MRSQQFCVFDVLMFVGLESLAANQELRAKIKELRVLESFIRSIPGININILTNSAFTLSLKGEVFDPDIHFLLLLFG